VLYIYFKNKPKTKQTDTSNISQTTGQVFGKFCDPKHAPVSKAIGMQELSIYLESCQKDSNIQSSATCCQAMMEVQVPTW
jgi:hypothetical protein